jgi:hypothetical protein
MVHLPSGRRGAVLAAASAAVVCLGALATFGPDGGTDPGYLAVGPAGPTGTAPATGNVPPDGGVEWVPLDGGPASGGPGASASASASVRSPGGTPRAQGRASASASAPEASPSPSPSRSPSSSPAPARLAVGGLTRAASDDRWCEYVTVTFTNTGGQPATTGTVTFGTHIIGLLGIDWATVETDEAVPVPVEGGAKKEKTWEICVDAWRVPLGMHVETQDVRLS